MSDRNSAERALERANKVYELMLCGLKDRSKTETVAALIVCYTSGYMDALDDFVAENKNENSRT